MQLSDSNLSRLTHSKLQRSLTKQDSLSLHRWVLLKNSILYTPASTLAHAKFHDDEPDFARRTRPPPANKWVQDPDDGQWRSTPPNAEYRQQDDVLTQEMERVAIVLGSSEHLAPPAPLGSGSIVPAAMFTNAYNIAISGGTFLNIGQIYKCESGGGPAFPIMVLGLQAVSFATRSHYPHCDHPFNTLPLLMPEPTSTSSLAIHLPMLHQEMKAVIGPFVIWLLIKTFVRRWSIERL